MYYGNTATKGPNESNIHFQHNDTTSNNSYGVSDNDDVDFDKQPLNISGKNKTQPLTLPPSSSTAAVEASSNKGKGRVTNYQHARNDNTTVVRNKRAGVTGNKLSKKENTSISTRDTNN